MCICLITSFICKAISTMYSNFLQRGPSYQIVKRCLNNLGDRRWWIAAYYLCMRNTSSFRSIIHIDIFLFYITYLIELPCLLQTFLPISDTEMLPTAFFMILLAFPWGKLGSNLIYCLTTMRLVLINTLKWPPEVPRYELIYLNNHRSLSKAWKVVYLYIKWDISWKLHTVALFASLSTGTTNLDW